MILHKGKWQYGQERGQVGEKGQEGTSGKTTGGDKWKIYRRGQVENTQERTGVGQAYVAGAAGTAYRPRMHMHSSQAMPGHAMLCPPSPQPHTLPVIGGCGRTRRVWWASVGEVGVVGCDVMISEVGVM
jgi:hypothetical protein